MTVQEKYLIHLSTFASFGPVRTSLLVKYFGSAQAAWKANKNELLEIGLKPPLVEKFIKHRNKFRWNPYFDRLKNQNINVLFDHDKKYPNQFKKIDSHPRALYVKGELLPSDKNAIAIVGTRKMTEYGISNVNREQGIKKNRESGTGNVGGISASVDAKGGFFSHGAWCFWSTFVPTRQVGESRKI